MCPPGNKCTTASIAIGISYLATSGEYCRSFEIRGKNTAQAGLACHAQGGAWRVRIRESISPGAAANTNLRQATIVGEALDANAEATARDARWESPPGGWEEAVRGDSEARSPPTESRAGGHFWVAV